MSIKMTKARFWEIVAASRRRFDPNRIDGNMDLQEEDLAEELKQLAPGDVAAFDEQFGQRMMESFRWDLWGAAYLMMGGCSNDGFDYFQRWLISMGQEVYERALRDPDSLAEAAFEPGVEDTSFEGFGTAAAIVYEEKTGDECPVEWNWPSKPAGERFEDSDEYFRANYPRIWAASRDR